MIHSHYSSLNQCVIVLNPALFLEARILVFYAHAVPPIGGQRIGGLDQSRCSTDARTEAHTLAVTLTD